MPRSAHNWRMGGWTGCESDPESAVLQTAKSCFITYYCQCTWEARTTLEEHWLLLGRGMLEEPLHLVPWHPASGWLQGHSATATAPLGFLKICFNPFKTFVSYGGTSTVEWGMLRGASESLPARPVGWDVGYQLLPRSGNVVLLKSQSSAVLQCVYMHFK